MKIDIYAAQMDDILDKLPIQIAQLSELIGLQATLVLVDKFGGLSFEVPHNTDSKNGQWLLKELGVEAAQTLIEYYKGDKLYINNCNGLRLYLRNQALVSAIYARMETGTAQHRAIQESAPLFGISERWAYEILKEVTDAKPQISLF